MMSKLALLLALAIGGLALCDGQEDPTPASFTCPGGGVFHGGNNSLDIVPTCAGGSVLCRTDGLEGQGQDCPGNGLCAATCADGSILILTDVNGTVTVATEGGTVVEVTGIFKGYGYCDSVYCDVSVDDIPTTPIVPGGLICPLGHAALCYTPGGLLPPPPPPSKPSRTPSPPPPTPSPPPSTPSPPPPTPSPPPPTPSLPPPTPSPPPPTPSPPPPTPSPPPPTPSPPPPRSPPPPPRVCQCDKKKVTFKWKGSPVKDISLCPGSPLPDKNKYTAKDNCGNYLRVKVYDSLRRPNRGPCCSMTRTLTAQCGYSEVTKNQKITFEDWVTFRSSRGAVKARCKCRSGEKVLTPKNFYRNGRVFKAVYKVKDVCGIEHTKTVTKY